MTLDLFENYNRAVRPIDFGTAYYSRPNTTTAEVDRCHDAYLYFYNLNLMDYWTDSEVDDYFNVRTFKHF